MEHRGLGCRELHCHRGECGGRAEGQNRIAGARLANALPPAAKASAVCKVMGCFETRLKENLLVGFGANRTIRQNIDVSMPSAFVGAEHSRFEVVCEDALQEALAKLRCPSRDLGTLGEEQSTEISSVAGKHRGRYHEEVRGAVWVGESDISSPVLAVLITGLGKNLKPRHLQLLGTYLFAHDSSSSNASCTIANFSLKRSPSCAVTASAKILVSESEKVKEGISVVWPPDLSIDHVGRKT